MAYYLGLVSTGCAILLGYAAIRYRRMRTMREEVELFIARFAEMERRVGLIETEAVTYINSMSKEITAALYEMRQILARAREIVHGAEAFLAQGSYYGLIRAQRLVRTDVLDTVAREPNAPPSSVPSCDWEFRLEELMQAVGITVAQAARRAGSVAGVGFSESTLDRLLDAGVILEDANGDE